MTHLTLLGGKGRVLNYLDPRVEDITIEDIAHALSLTCRFAGQGSRFYSVAEHSILVSYHVPRQHRLWALLHDAAEAYVCDLPSGLKHLPEMSAYRHVEDVLMDRIIERFGLAHTKPAVVSETDKLAARWEASHLGLYNPSWGPLPKWEGGLPEMSPESAELAFLWMYRRYQADQP